MAACVGFGLLFKSGAIMLERFQKRSRAHRNMSILLTPTLVGFLVFPGRFERHPSRRVPKKSEGARGLLICESPRNLYKRVEAFLECIHHRRVKMLAASGFDDLDGAVKTERIFVDPPTHQCP